MKRFLAGVLAAALLLAGCSGYELPERGAQTEQATELLTQAPTETPTETPTEALTEAPTEAPTDAPAELPTEPPVEPQTDAPEQTEPEEPTQEPTEPGKDYVLNTSTKKFHKPGCSSVKQMKEKNRRDYHGSRAELVEQGYTPCGKCHP